MSEVKTLKTLNLTYQEWIDAGVKLFGEDRMVWRFICPVCGHIASLQDYKDAGAPSGAAGFSCVGRYNSVCRDAFGGIGSGPCNYTAGGLFNVNPIYLTDKNFRVFEFAPIGLEDELEHPDVFRIVNTSMKAARAVIRISTNQALRVALRVSGYRGYSNLAKIITTELKHRRELGEKCSKN